MLPTHAAACILLLYTACWCKRAVCVGETTLAQEGGGEAIREEEAVVQVEAVAVLVKVGAQLAAAQGAQLAAAQGAGAGAGAESGELGKGGTQLAASKVGAQLGAGNRAGAAGRVLVKVGARAEGRVLVEGALAGAPRPLASMAHAALKNRAEGRVFLKGTLTGAPVQVLPSVVASMAPPALKHKQILRHVGDHILVQPRRWAHQLRVRAHHACFRANQPRVRAHQPGPSSRPMLPALHDQSGSLSESHLFVSSAQDLQTSPSGLPPIGRKEHQHPQASWPRTCKR